MKNNELEENWEYIRSELKRKYSAVSDEDLELSETDCADDKLDCLARKLGKEKEDLRQEIALNFAGIPKGPAES